MLRKDSNFTCDATRALCDSFSERPTETSLFCPTSPASITSCNTDDTGIESCGLSASPIFRQHRAKLMAPQQYTEPPPIPPKTTKSLSPKNILISECNSGTRNINFSLPVVSVSLNTKFKHPEVDPGLSPRSNRLLSVKRNDRRSLNAPSTISELSPSFIHSVTPPMHPCSIISHSSSAKCFGTLSCLPTTGSVRKCNLENCYISSEPRVCVSCDLRRPVQLCSCRVNRHWNKKALPQLNSESGFIHKIGTYNPSSTTKIDDHSLPSNKPRSSPCRVFRTGCGGLQWFTQTLNRILKTTVVRGRVDEKGRTAENVTNVKIPNANARISECVQDASFNNSSNKCILDNRSQVSCGGSLWRRRPSGCLSSVHLSCNSEMDVSSVSSVVIASALTLSSPKKHTSSSFPLSIDSDVFRRRSRTLLPCDRFNHKHSSNGGRTRPLPPSRTTKNPFIHSLIACDRCRPNVRPTESTKKRSRGTTSSQSAFRLSHKSTQPGSSCRSRIQHTPLTIDSSVCTPFSSNCCPHPSGCTVNHHSLRSQRTLSRLSDSSCFSSDGEHPDPNFVPLPARKHSVTPTRSCYDLIDSASPITADSLLACRCPSLFSPTLPKRSGSAQLVKTSSTDVFKHATNCESPDTCASNPHHQVRHVHHVHHVHHFYHHHHQLHHFEDPNSPSVLLSCPCSPTTNQSFVNSGHRAQPCCVMHPVTSVANSTSSENIQSKVWTAAKPPQISGEQPSCIPEIKTASTPSNADCADSSPHRIHQFCRHLPCSPLEPPHSQSSVGLTFLTTHVRSSVLPPSSPPSRILSTRNCPVDVPGSSTELPLSGSRLKPTRETVNTAEQTTTSSPTVSASLAGAVGTVATSQSLRLSRVPRVISTFAQRSMVREHPENRSSFQRSMLELRKMGWYWGPLSFQDAQVLLAKRPDGTFLVRDSGHDTYILSLSFRVRGVTYHTRIEHSQGRFSFWSQPQSHSASTMVEFIEKAVAHSISGQFHYFLQSSAQGQPPVEVPLLYPLSRFQMVPSLRHLARFAILSLIRRDHIDQLPLPRLILDYLMEKQCYVESLEAFEEAIRDRTPLEFRPRRTSSSNAGRVSAESVTNDRASIFGCHSRRSTPGQHSTNSSVVQTTPPPPC